jgi:hypothetical protein
MDGKTWKHSLTNLDASLRITAALLLIQAGRGLYL